MTPIQDIARLLADGSPDARAVLAADPATPAEALYYLMHDQRPRIRAAVAANSASPHQCWVPLAQDDDATVRHALAGRLALLAPGLPPPQQNRLAEAAWKALARLACDMVDDIRLAVAEAVQDLPNVPRALLMALARDPCPHVAAPILRLCPLLSEQDLLGLICAQPISATLAAIARRPAVSEAIADALVASGDAAVITALLNNQTAAIRETTLDALVIQAAERSEWQGPLVCRPVLPARAALALAGFVAEALLAPLARREDLSPELATHIRAIAADRIAGTPRPGETAEDAARRAAILVDAGALGEDTIRRAAEAGDSHFAAAALAGLAGVPNHVVTRAAATRCAKSLAGLCRRAGLSEETGGILIPLLAPAPPGADPAAPPGQIGEAELSWRIGALARGAVP